VTDEAPDAAVLAVSALSLTKRFDGRSLRGRPAQSVVAVDTIDPDVGHGEFFAMLGLPDCGETATPRTIAGLKFPTTGC